MSTNLPFSTAVGSLALHLKSDCDLAQVVEKEVCPIASTHPPTILGPFKGF
jgi:hypothetical protein